jgi:hypothetical protein
LAITSTGGSSQKRSTGATPSRRLIFVDGKISQDCDRQKILLAPRARWRQRTAASRPCRRAFHDQVLDAGALPLDVLSDPIDVWIAGRKAGASM